MQQLFRQYKFDDKGNELSIAEIHRACEELCEHERKDKDIKSLSISKQYLQAIDSGYAPSNPTLSKLYVLSKVMQIPFGDIMAAYGLFVGEVTGETEQTSNKAAMNIANQLENIAREIKKSTQ